MRACDGTGYSNMIPGSFGLTERLVFVVESVLGGMWAYRHHFTIINILDLLTAKELYTPGSDSMVHTVHMHTHISNSCT